MEQDGNVFPNAGFETLRSLNFRYQRLNLNADTLNLPIRTKCPVRKHSAPVPGMNHHPGGRHERRMTVHGANEQRRGKPLTVHSEIERNPRQSATGTNERPTAFLERARIRLSGIYVRRASRNQFRGKRKLERDEPWHVHDVPHHEYLSDFLYRKNAAEFRGIALNLNDFAGCETRRERYAEKPRTDGFLG